ncbi:MAG: hypothetical protein LBV67_00590 [Streptococcaceae bacterium]|nr:hypothetical protein [Streptococcaceae bacterium]
MKFDRVFIIRFLYALIGTAILAMGAALLIKATLGVDAFTAQNLGASGRLGLTLGTYQMLLSVVLGVIIFFLKRDLLGIGSVVNILLTGYFIQFFVFLMKDMQVVHLLGKIGLMLLALLIYSLGISLYSTSGLGAGPYDALAVLVQHYTKWKFIYARISVDSTFFLLGLVLGGPIGVATFLTAIVLGPLIGFWNVRVTTPSLEKLGAK